MEEITVNLETIIKQSRELMHLDLSNTGLTSGMMYRVVKAIKSSQSLMGVHLSGNEGLNEEFINKAEKKLQATKECKRDINFRDICEQTDKAFGVNTDTKKPLDPVEVELLRQIKFEKKVSSPLEDGSRDNNPKRHFILTRQLGHQFEMPGSQHWQLHTDNVKECWVCDK